MDSNSDSNCRDSSVERLPLVSIIILTSKYVTVIHLCKEISIRLTHVFEVWYSLKNVFKKILICGNSVLYSHTKAFFY